MPRAIWARRGASWRRSDGVDPAPPDVEPEVRRFLYISPFFPPLARTGSFRPLKFARHLPAEGWLPVVLADLWPGARIDPALAEAVPAGVRVVHDYGPSAGEAIRGVAAAPPLAREAGRPSPARAPGIFRGREWLPLGEAAFAIPHALRAARRVLAAEPVEAIMVNADPVAALVVGARLGAESGLPFLADLRDPWGPCVLRRPLRPATTRLLEGWAEAYVVRRAAKVILNTETTADDYRRHHDGLPAERFTFIRNHGDGELIRSGVGTIPQFPRFTLLFLGGFSRFVRPEPLLALLVELRARGIDTVRLALTERLDVESERRAEALGVAGMIETVGNLPYRDVGKLIDAADLLALIAPTRQRMQAKFYDYVTAERPILAIGEAHGELDAILEETKAGQRFRPGEISDMADWVAGHLAKGRHPEAPRPAAGLAEFTSATAARRLARLLDEVTGG